MIIYLAMVEDRHEDPQAYPFSTADAAIEFARRQADGEFYEELNVPEWLYCARYSAEGDSVWVVARELDAQN